TADEPRQISGPVLKDIGNWAFVIVYGRVVGNPDGESFPCEEIRSRHPVTIFGPPPRHSRTTSLDKRKHVVHNLPVAGTDLDGSDVFVFCKAGGNCEIDVFVATGS